jgi:hypothetical protein
MPKTLEERFREKVGPSDEFGCWPWMAGRNKEGYGRLKYDGKEVNAHRISYIIHQGPIPDGLYILHSCNRGHMGCVNPAHLRAGTHQENMIDRAMAGTTGQKLSAQDVLEIKALLEQEHLTKAEIGDLYGVTKENINAIKTGASWAHLTASS